MVGFTGKVRISLPKDTYGEEEARIAKRATKGGMTNPSMNKQGGGIRSL